MSWNKSLNVSWYPQNKNSTHSPSAQLDRCSVSHPLGFTLAFSSGHGGWFCEGFKSQCLKLKIHMPFVFCCGGVLAFLRVFSRILRNVWIHLPSHWSRGGGFWALHGLWGSSRQIQLLVVSDPLDDDSALVFSSFPHPCPLGISSQRNNPNTNFVSSSTSEGTPFSLNDSLSPSHWVWGPLRDRNSSRGAKRLLWRLLR